MAVAALVEYAASLYALAFTCLGTGQVEVRLTVGKASAKTLVSCRSRPETIDLRLSARRGDEFVQFTPTRRETVAFASKLTCSGGCG